MAYNPKDYFSKKPSKGAGEVTVTFDPRVITRKKGMTSQEITNYKREASRGTAIGNKTAQFGLSSSMGKDDRLFTLKLGIKTGRIKTVGEASALVSVTEKTIHKYLKELSIDFDKESGKINFLN